MKKSLTLLALTVLLSFYAVAQPTNLQTSYHNNVTTFSWNADNAALYYVIEIKQSWDYWPGEFIQNVYATSFQLTGISQSISIDWRVKAVYTQGESNFEYASFTIPCPEASNPVVSNITSTSATVSWTPAIGYNTNVSDFVLAYRKVGLSNWISLGHTSANQLTISNLQAETNYEWCVNQSCLYGYSSPLISTFTTAVAPPPPPPVCNSFGDNSNQWISYFKLGSINRTSGAESGGYVSTNLSTDLLIGSTNNNAQIKVGYNGGFSTKVFKIYIDFNNNTLYEESELIYGSANINNNRVLKFKINVPNNVSAGNYGMRVIMANAGTNITGCGTGFLGETEDYIVNLIGTSAKGMATNNIEQEIIFKIYPNPSQDYVNIEIPENAKSLQLLNMHGQVIDKINIEGKTKLTYTMTNLSSSNYFFQLQYENGKIETIRIQKN